MTLNDSWGFNRFDDGWKTPKTIVANLANCARGGGNYLLNIGPKPDGSIPEESVTVLEAVGKWLDTNGKAIYGAERGDFSWNSNANYTRRGNTLYIHQQYWPGHTPAADWLSYYQPQAVIALGGLKPKVLSARLLKTGQKVEFTQNEFSLRLTGLPLEAPDQPATVIEVECDGRAHHRPRSHPLPLAPLQSGNQLTPPFAPAFTSDLIEGWEASTSAQRINCEPANLASIGFCRAVYSCRSWWW